MSSCSISTQPTVSVIIPTYNRSSTILRAINSVINQTYKDFEIIVVDDASQDNTEEIVHNITDERVHYIKHAFNKGANAARNTGIRQASGKYIAFQDSDDEWLNDKLQQQLSIFDNIDNVGAVHTGYIRHENGVKEYLPKGELNITDGMLHTSLLYGNFISTQTLVVSSEHLYAINGFDENLPRLQDWELVLRLSKLCKFVFIDKPLVNVYFHPGCITSKPEKRIIAMKYILEKHSTDFKGHPLSLAEHTYNIGNDYLSLNNRKLAISYFYKAFKISIKPKYALGIFLLFFGIKTFNAIKRYSKLIRS